MYSDLLKDIHINYILNMYGNDKWYNVHDISTSINSITNNNNKKQKTAKLQLFVASHIKCISNSNPSHIVREYMCTVRLLSH